VVSTRTRIPGSIRRAVIERDGRVCQLCSRPVVVRTRRRGRARTHDHQLTLDHVVAVVNGGATSIDNLRVCCRRCNMRKGAR